jgi:hypothetical protein
MSSNTKKVNDPERRRSRRVRVLFSAIMNCKGWRSQIVEVIDLSETGARVECRFPVAAGSHVSLRIPGPAGRLNLASVVVTAGENHGHPVAGLRFDLPDDIRRTLREIIDRVEKTRARSEHPHRRETGVTKVIRRLADPRRHHGASPPGASL